MTNYIGSLAEETKGAWVNHVFLGSTKIATVANNEVRYHFQDHLGSANVVTNSSGTVIELIEYKPFGGFARRDQFGTSNAAWYYFTGKPLDEETGLIFYGARYYSPKLGKFITPDTIVQDPSDPQTFNRYSYTNNNPINLIDPDGHSWKGFWKKYGDFISPLGRAIFTGDWKNLGYQVLNIATMAIGVATGNPWLVASGALAYLSRATSHVGGNASVGISRGLGYAAIAASVVGAFYTPSAGAPSAELGYDNFGNYVGAPAVELDPIVVILEKANTKSNILNGVVDWLAENYEIIQTGLSIAGTVPVFGEAFDLASAGLSLAAGDKVGASLSAVSAIPFIGWAGTAGKVGRNFSNGGEFLFKNVHKGTFENKMQSLKYHLTVHGKGRSAVQYVEDAQQFYKNNTIYGKPVILRDGSKGFKLGNRNQGGYWTDEGKLVTYWD